MKTVSIGDTHGAAVAGVVAEIIDSHDKFIFMGDYVDGFGIDNQEMLKNLFEIIDLKKRYPEKVILLWGNHDIQYLMGYDSQGCSGFRPEMNDAFYEIFHTSYDLFRLSYQVGDWLWTHAGVNNWWFKRRFKPIESIENDKVPVSELLNTAFREQFPGIFDYGHKRGGILKAGGPLWCDIDELIPDPLRGYNQIAGHNRVEKIESVLWHDKEIIFVDVLENEATVSAASFYYREL